MPKTIHKSAAKNARREKHSKKHKHIKLQKHRSNDKHVAKRTVLAKFSTKQVPLRTQLSAGPGVLRRLIIPGPLGTLPLELTPFAPMPPQCGTDIPMNPSQFAANMAYDARNRLAINTPPQRCHGLNDFKQKAIAATKSKKHRKQEESESVSSSSSEGFYDEEAYSEGSEQ